MHDYVRKQGLYASGWEELGARKTMLRGEPKLIPNPRFAQRGFSVSRGDWVQQTYAVGAPLFHDPKLSYFAINCGVPAFRLRANDLEDEVGRQIATEWENRKRLAPGVSTPTIDALIARATKAGATAAKVCGAGGGGCLFCYGPPDARVAIESALSTGEAQVLDFTIESDGLRFES